MLEVLALHAFTLGGYSLPLFFVVIRSFLNVSVFILMAGFGSFFSFTKDDNVIHYYKKRIRHLFIPYMIITLPYYTYFFMTGQQDLIPVYWGRTMFEIKSQFLLFLGHLTTLGYWFEGNYNGMWFLSFIIILYFCFPFAYKLVFRDSCRRDLLALGQPAVERIILLFLIIMGGRYLMQMTVPRYYQAILSVPLAYTSLFFVGVLFGSWSYYRDKVDGNKLVFFSLLIWLTNIKIVAFVILISYIFSNLKDGLILKILRWFGRYSLELYIIHLTLFSVISLINSRTGMNLSYGYILSFDYLISICLAYVVNKLSKKILSLG